MTTVRELEDVVRQQQEELDALRAQVARWQSQFSTGRKRDIAFTNSANEVPPLYTALALADTAGTAFEVPGDYPFTRGIHPTGYRGKLWTMRQFAGFGTARETNQRYKFLLSQGQTGLSVAFDFPTLMGYDSDHVRSEGEVGKCGVAISSLADMETLFEGIPLDKVSTSMTINGPAIILLCFYIAAAEKQGVDASKLQGTVQNDILKEYMAQHAWCFPIEPALRLIVDGFEWCAQHAPNWNTISISGYHIREAGSTAAQELAFTLADGFTYVERGVARGLDVDEFAPRLSFFWGHPQRLLRGDRQVAGGTTHLGAPSQGAVRRKKSALVDDAFSFADRWCHVDGATADEQRGSRGLSGAGRGARRYAVVAHQLDGRDALVANGVRGAGRAPHATGAGVRDRRAQCDRSAGRIVLRGSAHRSTRS
jgi:hypothetical protein